MAKNRTYHESVADWLERRRKGSAPTRGSKTAAPRRTSEAQPKPKPKRKDRLKGIT